jgi:hypothetical protein
MFLSMFFAIMLVILLLVLFFLALSKLAVMTMVVIGFIFIIMVVIARVWTGKWPFKECPDCFHWTLQASRVCTKCGYRFPEWVDFNEKTRRGVTPEETKHSGAARKFRSREEYEKWKAKQLHGKPDKQEPKIT